MTAGPILVLGITPRSGTNYLYDLLRLHGDCAPARAPVWEDNLLSRADLLDSYARSVAATWPGGEHLGEGLLRALGDSMVAFLATDPCRRLLTKTPHVHNLELLPAVFPDARAVIIVRDGRAVVQSSLDTFGGRFETHARRWAAAAETIRRFDQRHRGADEPVHHRIVRYEDLWRDLEGTLTPVLDFLGLDPAGYDMEAASRLPVRGSSTQRRGGQVDWAPVERPAGFDPTARFDHWSQRMRDRFDHIAGRQLEHFGYERHRRAPSAWRGAADRAIDVAWAAAGPVRRARRRVLDAGRRSVAGGGW